MNVFVATLFAESLASIVTVKSLVSSLPQLVTLGVPLIFLLVGSYVTPAGRSFTVIVAPGLFVVTLISLIAFPSTTVWSLIVSIVVTGFDVASLGLEPLAVSSASVYPSPSSSVSVTSGIPSLSVSL